MNKIIKQGALALSLFAGAALVSGPVFAELDPRSRPFRRDVEPHRTVTPLSPGVARLR